MRMWCRRLKPATAFLDNPGPLGRQRLPGRHRQRRRARFQLSPVIATGSEVHLALNARDRLAGEGVKARVVSLPCWSLFKEQAEPYRNQVLPVGLPSVTIEAGVTLGWNSYLGPSAAVVGVDRYDASAPGEVVMREYGFTVENVCQQVRTLLSVIQT